MIWHVVQMAASNEPEVVHAEATHTQGSDASNANLHNRFWLDMLVLHMRHQSCYMLHTGEVTPNTSLGHHLAVNSCSTSTPKLQISLSMLDG